MLLVSTLFRCCINRPFESIIKFCIKEIVKYSFESQNTVACSTVWSSFSLPGSSLTRLRIRVGLVLLRLSTIF